MRFGARRSRQRWRIVSWCQGKAHGRLAGRTADYIVWRSYRPDTGETLVPMDDMLLHVPPLSVYVAVIVPTHT